MRLRRAAPVAAVLASVAVVAAACAIPTQSEPSAIASSRVPFHLLDPHPPTTTTTQPKVSTYISAKVYFLNADANNALMIETSGAGALT